MNLLHLFLSDFKAGGVLMAVIFLVSVIAWLIGIKKLFFLTGMSVSRNRFLAKTDAFFNRKKPSERPTGFEDYDYLFARIVAAVNGGAVGCKGIMREFLIGTVPRLERHFSTMSAWISTAPLLGLLGTVIGMIQTFHVITDFGIGNPSLTAQGISVALLTTQAGLTAAFPAMIFHNYLISRKNALVAHMLKDCEMLVNSITSAVESTGEEYYV